MPKDKEEVKEKKEVEEQFVVVEVPTQHTPLIQDRKNPETLYNELTAFCKVMNDISDIKEGIIGSK